MDRQASLREFIERLQSFTQRFDRHFDKLLTPGDLVPTRLAEAVRYSALAPGKRIRPYLVVRSCQLVGGSHDNAIPVAVALECVHGFSLIHDDLPAMDDDDDRRGQPTAHKKFDEATAILAGDALVFLAFQLIVQHVGDSDRAIALVGELADASGWGGMIGGQMRDLESEEMPADRLLVESIHRQKTARLMEAACRMGALCAAARTEIVESLGSFGRELGMAFQIADDLLDVGADGEVVSDGGDDRTKQTLPACVGMEMSVAMAQERVSQAIAYLEQFGEAAKDLRALATFVINRDY